MNKTYAEQLYEKRKKLEKILSKKLFWSDVRNKRIMEMEKVKKEIGEIGTEVNYLEEDLEIAKSLVGEDNLIVEALQDAIDSIDSELRTQA